MRQITAPELKYYLDSTERPPLLVDVREPWEYHICHIENSKLIPMGQVMRALHELNQEDELVLICHHGVRSQRVGAYLYEAGYQNVINLAGGINAWAREVDPRMPTY